MTTYLLKGVQRQQNENHVDRSNDDDESDSVITNKNNIKYVRHAVEQAFACILFATQTSNTNNHNNELNENASAFFDSLVIHFTLMSLSFYHSKMEKKLRDRIKQSHKETNDFINNLDMKYSSALNQSQQKIHVNNKSQGDCSNLDFFIIIDALTNVLNNDVDADYFPIVSRSILLMIDLSQLISSIHNEKNEKNVINQALFDYLAKKIAQLCYERSWSTKISG